jgi:Cell division protein FtsI/penicillin-binding protein 2
MTSVVEDGTAMGVSSSEYTVAGKTGSAEATSGTHSWFIGFSNVNNPDIVVCVVVENAEDDGNGAVPIAKQIFDAYHN